jgi:hypothetical protein
MRWVAAALSVVSSAGARPWPTSWHAKRSLGRRSASGAPIRSSGGGELILAACSAVLCVAATVGAVRRFRAGSAGSGETMMWIGLGFLAVSALSIAAGWLGLRVPTRPGTAGTAPSHWRDRPAVRVPREGCRC